MGQIIKNKKIFGSGTMRTGGTLVCNLLSTHKDVVILADIVHFFRYIYKRYDPINSKTSLYRLCGELSLRLKLRDDIHINRETFFNLVLKKKANNYSDVYECIFEVILKKIKNKKIIGEYANGEWQSIDHFLSFKKENKAFHVIRDPRAVLSSWKKITFSKGYKYLNSIFNWVDSFDHYLKYKKKYSNKKYMLLKFEDIHKNPKKIATELCKFLNIRFDKNMTSTKKWKSLLSNKFVYVNESAYDYKFKVYGFSINRINTWEKYLSEWEINLVNYICGNRLKKMGYNSPKPIKSLTLKGIKILQKDKFLRERYEEFNKNNKGNNLMLNDPTDPKNWESRIKPGTRFINTNEYKIFKKELRKIKLISEKYK